MIKLLTFANVLTCIIKSKREKRKKKIALKQTSKKQNGRQTKPYVSKPRTSKFYRMYKKTPHMNFIERT
jgi:hypothetical protein